MSQEALRQALVFTGLHIVERDRLEKMKYQVCFKPRSMKDLKKIPFKFQRRIVKKIEEMGDDLRWTPNIGQLDKV